MTKIAMLTALMLIQFNSLNAETTLTEEQMDRITAGFLASASDDNAFFKAVASAEGTAAEASAEVSSDFAEAASTADGVTAVATVEIGFDFAKANGSATASAEASGNASSASASVTTADAAPQLLSSPSLGVTLYSSLRIMPVRTLRVRF